MRSKILIILLAFCLVSCIHLRTEYPKITYYNLSGSPTIISTDFQIDAALQIRDVEPASGIEGEYLYSSSENSQIKKYFYHRWITDISSVATDFFKRRYTELNVFQRGVINTSSAVLPDYILELRLQQMDCMSAVNHPTDSSYVAVSVLATLIKAPAGLGKAQTLMSKSFISKVKRSDANIESIVPAYDKAFSNLSDMIFAEMYYQFKK